MHLDIYAYISYFIILRYVIWFCGHEPTLSRYGPWPDIWHTERVGWGARVGSRMQPALGCGTFLLSSVSLTFHTHNHSTFPPHSENTAPCDMCVELRMQN
jgi:hypothetical protein